MPERHRRSSSVYDAHSKRKNPDLLNKKIYLSGRQITVGIMIGVFLTIVTIILHSIAFVTPHWKEISPHTSSLYVDSVDALIRTETLVYFNSIHRFTRHSYGLFQRCEYILTNASKLIHKLEANINHHFHHQDKTCTKNFLPSYADDQFNRCHSLQYYRFCSRTNEKIFDINNDYLRATFDISSNSHPTIDSTSACKCHYPKYVKACQIIGTMALICLCLTVALFASFPFVKTKHQRLKVKCFGVLASFFSCLFILINIAVVLNYLHYESLEYLVAIERHYRSNQIYKLSEDTKQATNRFLSSLDIRIGYSTILAWIAFALSIIDGIFLMGTCKIRYHLDDPLRRSSTISRDSLQYNNKINNEEHRASTTLFTSTETTTDSQSIRRSPSLALPFLPTTVISKSNEQSPSHLHSLPSCLKRSSTPRIHFEDEV